ncbi:Mbeg1-like protein [Campylobacter concisus]
MNTLKNLTNKEMVDKLRVYADIADVSYAFFEYIDENEIWSFSDKFYNNVILEKPNPRWDYADGINWKSEITKENETVLSKNNKREIGQPTAYALCVEARFMQDLTIKKPKSDENEEDEFVKIDNEIKNFIYVDKKTKEQRIFINEEGYHQISERTKNFTSRFKLLKHQKNDNEGFSATLFEDTKDNDKRILVFRGTEMNLTEEPADIWADIMLASGHVPTQVNSLINFFLDNVIPILKEDEKINICGHSLGGFLTQACAFIFPEYIDEIYTFNSPGLLSKIKREEDYTTETISDALFIGDTALNEPHLLDKAKNIINIKQKLYTNISLANEDHTYLPAPLNVNNIYHMKTDNDSLAFNNKLYENAIQDLGVDINGNEVLINIGNVDAILNTNVSISSHFLTYTAATLYFFSYLLEQKDNDEKTKNVSLKGTFLYLNEFMEQNYKLIFDLDTNLSMQYNSVNFNMDNKATISPITYNKNKNWLLLILLNNIKHDLDIRTDHYLKDEQEALIIEDIFKLSDEKRYTKIISKEEIEKFKQSGCENIEDKRAMHKCRTYKVVDESSSDVTTTKADASKLYTYTSNFTRSLSSQDEKAYFMKKSEQTYSLLFDNSTQSGSINLYDVKDRGEIKFGFLSASSSVYVDKDKESLAIFTKDKDIVDIEKIYEKIRDEIWHGKPRKLQGRSLLKRYTSKRCKRS